MTHMRVLTQVKVHIPAAADEFHMAKIVSKIFVKTVRVSPQAIHLP